MSVCVDSRRDETRYTHHGKVTLTVTNYHQQTTYPFRFFKKKKKGRTNCVRSIRILPHQGQSVVSVKIAPVKYPAIIIKLVAIKTKLNDEVREQLVFEGCDAIRYDCEEESIVSM